MFKKSVVQKVVVAAAIMKNNKVLILQRSEQEDVLPGMWELPSGKKEPLETSEKALLREVKEETGLDVEIIAPFFIFNYQIEKAEEISDSTQINFLVRSVNENDVKLSSEHQDFAWIGGKDFDRHELSPNIKESIKKAFEMFYKLN